MVKMKDIVEQYTEEHIELAKKFAKIIKGNEAKVLALYQVTPFFTFGSPEELKQLLEKLD